MEPNLTTDSNATSTLDAPSTAPPGHWPDAWRELWAEREAIAWEGGAADPAAVADAEVDDAIAAGDL